MLRLFVLITVLLYCNGCYSPDTEPTDEGCPDKDGNIHEFDSQWEEGTEICVCTFTRTICCPRVDPDDMNFEQYIDEAFSGDSEENSNEAGGNSAMSGENAAAAAAAVAAAAA